MTRQEWTNRCARQLRLRKPDLAWRHALMEARGLANDQAELHGASGLAWQSPEDAADECDAMGTEED